MPPNKWRFDIGQDWEVLGDNLDSVSSRTIPDTILQAWSFHHFPLGYLEKGALRFIDVTDKPELAIELEDDNQLITDFEDEKARKGLECTVKGKAQRNNLYALVWQAFAATSTAPLTSRSPLLALLSRPPMPILSSLPVPTSSHSPVPASSSPPVSASSSPSILALSSSFVLALSSRSVLSPTPTDLTSSALRTFKRVLSDESLRRRSTSLSPIKSLCPFLTLGPLSEKNDRKAAF